MRIYALAVSKMPSICVDAPISHGELPVYEVSFYLDGMQYVRVFALFMVRVLQVSAMPKGAQFFVTESERRLDLVFVEAAEFRETVFNSI